MPATRTLADQLRRIEAELADQRDARAAAARELEPAKQAYASSSDPLSTGSPAFKAYKAAREKAAGIDARIDELTELQVETLKAMGKDPATRGRSDGAAAGGDGWARAARELDLANGVTRVDVDAESLIRRPMAAVTTTPGSGLTSPAQYVGFNQAGLDRRFLYPLLLRGELGDGDLAITDFRQTGGRKAATIAASNDTVTSNGHGYANGERVVFVKLTGGAGLTVGSIYFVRDTAANTFKVAATAGGAAVDVTTDYTAATVINLETLGRTVTGAVERDPIATTEKAKLDLAIELRNDPVKQFAAVVEDVPSKLFEVIEPLQAFLRSELLWQIDRGLDAHVVARILAADPLASSTGTGLIEKARHAIATMHDVGAQPTVLAVSAQDAATLDLTKTTDGLYIFVPRDTGSASPLWNLRIAEVAGLASPMVIDPVMLGRLFPATGRILVDPYTGLTTNEVRARAEVEALYHVRDANGACVLT